MRRMDGLGPPRSSIGSSSLGGSITEEWVFDEPPAFSLGLDCGMGNPWGESWAKASLVKAVGLVSKAADTLGVALPFDVKADALGDCVAPKTTATPRMIIAEEEVLRSSNHTPVSADESEDPELELCLRQLGRDYPALVQHPVIRVAPGIYHIAQRQVKVYVEEGEDGNVVMVRDGPLTQPFLDYVFDTGENEDFDIVQSSTNLCTLPEHARLQVPDAPATECRLTAMREAKAQAEKREEHATYLYSVGAVYTN